jgi:hypothetical protein
MAYMTAKKRKQIVDNTWAGILEQIDQELQRRKKRSPNSRRTKLLESLRKLALKRNGPGMIAITPEYVRLTRTLPPGVYASRHGVPGVYLDTERLDKGVRCSTLEFGIVHPQIYR